MESTTQQVKKLFKAASDAKKKKDFGNALQCYRQAAELDPTSAQPLLLIALTLVDQEKFSEAREVANDVIKRWLEGPGLHHAYVIIGRCYQAQGRLLKAEKAFRKALAINPCSGNWIFLGCAIGNQGRRNESTQCYVEALKLDPNDEEAHYNLGCEYKLRNQFWGAEKHLRRAIDINPKYSRAYAELGRVLQLHKKDLQEAIRLYRKSIRLNPNYGWSRIYLGVAYERLGNKKAAETQYLKALEIWPDSPQPYWCYGGFLRDIGGRDSLAEEYLRKAVELDPKDGVAHYELGKGLLKWNRIREATRSLKKAARLGHERAGKLLEKIGAPSRSS